MSLDESRFARLAEETLEHMGDVVDAVLGEEIDVDAQGHVLTLELPDGGQYVINAHAPNREIWLSSPVSGASHYLYENDRWVSTRDGSVHLYDVVANELNGKFGTAVAF